MMGRAMIAPSPMSVIHRVCAVWTMKAKSLAGCSAMPKVEKVMITAACHAPIPACTGTITDILLMAKAIHATEKGMCWVASKAKSAK